MIQARFGKTACNTRSDTIGSRGYLGRIEIIDEFRSSFSTCRKQTLLGRPERSPRQSRADKFLVSVFDKGIDIVPGCPVGILCIKRRNVFIQRVKHVSDILLNVFTLQLGKLVIITNREIT
jgi:hypothetical protein